MNVLILVDDRDSHGEGCDCGLCNSVGMSYGAGIFQTPPGATEDDDIVWTECEMLGREYGASEDAALSNARLTCKANGWNVIQEPV